jgi:hypothetical protein
MAMKTTPSSGQSIRKEMYNSNNHHNTIHDRIGLSLRPDHIHLTTLSLLLLGDQYRLETLRRQDSKMSTRCNVHLEAHQAE